MSDNCIYGFGCKVKLGFSETVEKVSSLLQRRGFVIHTRLDLDEVLGKEHRVTYGNYVILGACNAEYARQLFRADQKIGLLMPCNIIVYEIEGGGCQVMAKDPVLIMDLFKDPLVLDASIRLKQQLEEVIEELVAGN